MSGAERRASVTAMRVLRAYAPRLRRYTAIQARHDERHEWRVTFMR